MLYFTYGCYLNGINGGPLPRSKSLVFIDTRLFENTIKGVTHMLTIEGLIAVLGLCITSFALGYSIGNNSKR